MNGTKSMKTSNNGGKRMQWRKAFWPACSIGLAALLATTVATSTSTANPFHPRPPKQNFTRVLEPDNPNPMIARGVVIEPQAKWYKASGMGPAALNTGAPAGTPEAFIDTTVFPEGELPAGVTLTEAQGINALNQIKASLAEQNLSLEQVVSMRVFLDNEPGTDRADYAGWNRAYRQFFANTDLETGEVIEVPMGTAEPAEPLVVNSGRPSRFALEVGSLPVPGWLVEVEVDAIFPAKR